MTKTALWRALALFGKKDDRRTRPARRLNPDNAGIEALAKKECEGATRTLATRED